MSLKGSGSTSNCQSFEEDPSSSSPRGNKSMGRWGDPWNGPTSLFCLLQFSIMLICLLCLGTESIAADAATNAQN